MYKGEITVTLLIGLLAGAWFYIKKPKPQKTTKSELILVDSDRYYVSSGDTSKYTQRIIMDQDSNVVTVDNWPSISNFDLKVLPRMSITEAQDTVVVFDLLVYNPINGYYNAITTLVDQID